MYSPFLHFRRRHQQEIPMFPYSLIRILLAFLSNVSIISTSEICNGKNETQQGVVTDSLLFTGIGLGYLTFVTWWLNALASVAFISVYGFCVRPL